MMANTRSKSPMLVTLMLVPSLIGGRRFSAFAQ